MPEPPQRATLPTARAVPLKGCQMWFDKPFNSAIYGLSNHFGRSTRTKMVYQTILAEASKPKWFIKPLNSAINSSQSRQLTHDLLFRPIKNQLHSCQEVHVRRIIVSPLLTMDGSYNRFV